MSESVAVVVPVEVIPKAVIYVKSEMMGHIIKREVKNLSISRGKYAQYPNAVFMEFIPAGKRKRVRMVLSYAPYAIVLRGHGHPEPEPLFSVPVSDNGEVAVSKSRYSSFSPEFGNDFNAVIDPYLEANPGVLVADFRGVNTY